MKTCFTIFVLLISGSQVLLCQSPDSVIAIDAISVEAYQVSRQLKTIPGSLSLLTSEGLNIANATNLADPLNTLPGVSMQTGTYTTNRIVIRGMGSRTPYNTNRIRSYLNDIPLTTSDGLSSPEEIEIQNIGRLELIKGPSSALYGSGLGGSISLFTPVISQSFIRAGVRYGSYNTWKINASGNFHRNRSYLWTDLSHFQSEGWRENSRYKRTSFIVAGSAFSGKSKIDYLVLLTGVYGGIPSSIGKTLFERSPESAAVNWKEAGGYKKYSRVVAGVSLTSRFSERITNKLILFGRGTDSYEKRPFNNLDDHSVSGGIRNKLTFQTDKLDWVFGMEFVPEQYTWQLDTNDVLINRNREHRNQLNVFSMAYFRPYKGLNISVAGAVNYIQFRLKDRFPENGNQTAEREFPVIFSPRVGVNYSPGDHWSVYASAGHGFSLPSPEETLLPEGDVNPGIKHEEGWQFEAGSRINISGEKFGLDITYYRIGLNNLLVTKRITEELFTGINAGKTRHQGLELTLHSGIINLQQFPGSLDAMLSYTQSRNRFISFTDDGNLFDGKSLPGIPDKIAVLQFEWTPVDLLQIYFDIRYTGEQYLNDFNNLAHGDYMVGNVKLNAFFTPGRINSMDIFAGINNVTSTKYASMLIVNARGFGGSEPRYYYPGMPRNFYAGIILTF